MELVSPRDLMLYDSSFMQMSASCLKVIYRYRKQLCAGVPVGFQ